MAALAAALLAHGRPRPLAPVLAAALPSSPRLGDPVPAPVLGHSWASRRSGSEFVDRDPAAGGGFEAGHEGGHASGR
jgi:hypothetical protein